MSSSLERINPLTIINNEITGNQTLALHLQRYHFAGKHLVPGTVADIACGVGYGSYLLATEYAETISSIQAIDIDEESIAFARQQYQHTKIAFACANATQFQSPVALNNIVSLETIEHLPNPRLFVQQLIKQLAPGGRFIASVPVTPSMDANPYHLSDFTRRSFKKMFNAEGMKEIHSFIQVQPYSFVAVIKNKEERFSDKRKNLMGYYLTHPGKFFLRLKSVLTDGFTNKYLVVVFEKSQ